VGYGIKDVANVMLINKKTGEKVEVSTTSVSLSYEPQPDFLRKGEFTMSVDADVDFEKPKGWLTETERKYFDEKLNEKDDIQFKETIVKYMNEVKPDHHQEWTWDKVNKALNGEYIFLYPLFLNAVAYFDAKGEW
jgi:hypothetical protein